ncbi:MULTISPECIES: efflux RND transporter periplasmic adaptor subunit [unclassified Roseitalea]|uniref:efflux RND transporter periplasmic adaptor subunit n=1 Tax=unclassified Roseitalea TaxID=2639107 RepID=UPI00273E96FD|nr:MULTISPECIES: efflux RND transporter periplasmic adaptor subunit [unclassified Roseitalea]
MKAHRYAAILVFIACAGWVLTGDLSYVGSATGQDDQAETTADPAPSAAEGETAQPRALQSVAVAVVPGLEHRRTIRVSGVTEADKRTELTARAGGIIEQLPVAEGDQVTEGQVIARIAAEGREAAARSAEQALEQARSEFEARRELVERGTLPRLQLDQFKSALLQAESQYEAAKVELERLEVEVPFDGIIDEVMVEEGGTVNQGTPVANLIALDPIIGVGEVNESDLRSVRVGGDAQLRLVTGEVVDGTVRYVSREAQPRTRTFTVEVEVPNPDLAVPAGMTAEVLLRGEAVHATPVPRSVVTLNDEGELGIRAVDEEDRVVFYPIDLVDDSTGALLLGGIPRGARIIVAGQNLVTEDQKVEAVQADREMIDRLIAEATDGAAIQ